MGILKKIITFPAEVFLRLRNFLYRLFFGIMNLVLGATIISIGVLSLASLLSYNALDKSLNTVSDSPTENILGVPGSYISDILVQSLGILSIIIPIILIVFGFYKIIGKLKNLWMKLTLVLIGLFLLAASFEMAFGSGGIFGSVFLKEINSLIYKLSIILNTNLLENNLFIYSFYSLLGVFSSTIITYGLLPSVIKEHNLINKKSNETEQEILKTPDNTIKKKRKIFAPIIKRARKQKK